MSCKHEVIQIEFKKFQSDSRLSLRINAGLATAPRSIHNIETYVGIIFVYAPVPSASLLVTMTHERSVEHVKITLFSLYMFFNITLIIICYYS